VRAKLKLRRHPPSIAHAVVTLAELSTLLRPVLNSDLCTLCLCWSAGRRRLPCCVFYVKNIPIF
jgi:hypothetical protein